MGTQTPLDRDPRGQNQESIGKPPQAPLAQRLTRLDRLQRTLSPLPGGFLPDAIFREKRIPAELQQFDTCGTNCNEGGNQFPCANDNFQVDEIVLTVDTDDWAGREGHIEYYHGIHPYEVQSTRVEVLIDDMKIDDVSTKGCNEPTLRETDSFEITGGGSVITFRVIDSDATKWWSHGWFNLGRGSESQENLQSDTWLVIEPLITTLF